MKEMTDLDRLLVEMISFRLYKRGKKPLMGIDPRSRIKKGIWTDEGVDLDLLFPSLGITIDLSSLDVLFNTSETIVRKGLFRKKVPHRSCNDMKDINEISLLSEGVGQKKDSTSGHDEMVSSYLLHPFIETRTAHGLRDLMEAIEVPRASVSEMPDISPRVAFRTLQEGNGMVGDDDISSLFDRKVDKDGWIRFSRSGIIKDLTSLIEFMLSGSEKEIGPALDGGQLSAFCRKGLKSIYLEGFFVDAEEGEGDTENVRSRFGRFLMEGPLSERTFIDVVLPHLEHLHTCSPKQARRSSRELIHVMDNRSSKFLQEIVFQAPPKNRPSIISLIGATGDHGAVRTLRKLHDFSSVDADRRAALEALKELGEDA